MSTRLENQAGEWLQAQLNPAMGRLPSSWDLDQFLAALDSFFGGGVTPQSKERELQALRYATTVLDLAISFQNITKTFPEAWPNHALIFVFSEKLSHPVRYELVGRGPVPTKFRDYVAAAIAIEQNQAAASSHRPQSGRHSRSSRASLP